MINLNHLIKTKADYYDALEQMQDLEHFFKHAPLFFEPETEYFTSEEFIIYEYDKQHERKTIDLYRDAYIEYYFSLYTEEGYFFSKRNNRIFGVELGSEKTRNTLFQKLNNELSLDIPYVSEDLILESLYNGHPFDNVEKIYKIVSEINTCTDHNMVWSFIYEQLINKYEDYVRSKISSEDIIEIIKTRSIEASLGLILSDTVCLSEDKKNVLYCYEDKPLHEYKDFTDYDYSAVEYEILNYEYKKNEVTLSLEEAKSMYMAEHIYNYCGLFKTGFYNGKFQQYQYVQKARDVITNTNQIKRALFNTLDKIEAEFNIENYDTSAIEITRMKLTKDGRNQQFEILLSLLEKAKVDFVIEDEKGNVFYPFLANIFYQAISSQQIVDEHKDWLSSFQDFKYNSTKLGYVLPIYIDGSIDKKMDYLEHVKYNQIWHYTLTLYAKQYQTTYQDMKKLVKFFKFKNQNNHSNSFVKPMEGIPSEIVEINKFSDEVI